MVSFFQIGTIVVPFPRCCKLCGKVNLIVICLVWYCLSFLLLSFSLHGTFTMEPSERQRSIVSEFVVVGGGGVGVVSPLVVVVF